MLKPIMIEVLEVNLLFSIATIFPTMLGFSWIYKDQMAVRVERDIRIGRGGCKNERDNNTK